MKRVAEVGKAVSTNRYDVLSELDADYCFLEAQELEQDLKRVEREYAAGAGDDLSTKRSSPPAPVSTESDMESGSLQSHSNSDL